MKIEYWKYDDVSENGICANGGHVDTNPRIRIEKGDRVEHGFLISESGVNAISKSDVENKYWIMMTDGRKPDGTMQGMTCSFDSIQELNRFLGEGICGG